MDGVRKQSFPETSRSKTHIHTHTHSKTKPKCQKFSGWHISDNCDLLCKRNRKGNVAAKKIVLTTRVSFKTLYSVLASWHACVCVWLRVMHKLWPFPKTRTRRCIFCITIAFGHLFSAWGHGFNYMSSLCYFCASWSHQCVRSVLPNGMKVWEVYSLNVSRVHLPHTRAPELMELGITRPNDETQIKPSTALTRVLHHIIITQTCKVQGHLHNLTHSPYAISR